MRVFLSALLFFAATVPVMAQKGEGPTEAPGAAPAETTQAGINSLEFYSEAEERLLNERQDLLDRESAMGWPIWVGAPGTRIFIVEEAEYRRILGLLRDWVNSDFFDSRDIEYLPLLDQYLFESLGIEAIANLQGAELDAQVNQALVNRERLLHTYEAALNYAQAKFDYHATLQSFNERPDIDQVFTSTYGDIHWREGYYNIRNNTLEIEDIYEDLDRAGWVVEGSWGRQNDPDYRGGFEFLFSSACQFAGTWWNSGEEPGTAANWTGECR
ncbi:MAG: hypothetical protein AAF414_11375 [Pseudomonadota bacterium]